MRGWFLHTVVVALLLGGCTVGPDYVAPRPDLPSQWSEKLPVSDHRDTPPPALWWRGFHDPVLNRLAVRATASNLDLRIAAQRLTEARADRDAAAASARPVITAGLLDAEMRTSETVAWPPGIGGYRMEQGGLDVSWELDVFGGTRRAVEAADALVGVSLEERHAIMVSLLAEVAFDYVTLRASQARLEVAERSIAVQRQTLALTQRAYAAGIGRDIDVARARAAVEIAEGQVPPLDAAVARMSHALSVLVGGFPGDLQAELTQAAEPGVPSPPPLPNILPSDVLRRRPDIRKAERRIAAATAQVGVTTAELFPRFLIPLGIGFLASDVQALLQAQSMIWEVGVAAGQTVYDGGRSDARVRAARAVAEADRLAYLRIIRTAFREVEDSLSNLAAERRRHRALEKAWDDERQALARTTKLYAQGLCDFVKVLDSQRTTVLLEDAVVQSQWHEVVDVIAFYKATGGGWSQE